MNSSRCRRAALKRASVSPSSPLNANRKVSTQSHDQEIRETTKFKTGTRVLRATSRREPTQRANLDDEKIAFSRQKSLRPHFAASHKRPIFHIIIRSKRVQPRLVSASDPRVRPRPSAGRNDDGRDHESKDPGFRQRFETPSPWSSGHSPKKYVRPPSQEQDELF
jgi:hypothetical protein